MLCHLLGTKGFEAPNHQVLPLGSSPRPDCQWFPGPTDWLRPSQARVHLKGHQEVPGHQLLCPKPHSAPNHARHPSANPQLPPPDSHMTWAACCLGFFGFLCAGEFTVTSVAEFDQGEHLSIANVAVDSHSIPTLLSVRIKQSKTDPFRRGVDIYIGKASPPRCPVSAMVGYLAVQGPRPGPLFLYGNGSSLSRQRLVVSVQGWTRACMQSIASVSERP